MTASALPPARPLVRPPVRRGLPFPHGRTARRLDWVHLPAHVRAAVEARIGSPVTGWSSQDAGFTPGLASVLECADGSRHFVKAASAVAQRAIADAYREEGRRLATLPASAPAPRLRWTHDEDWVVLGIEHVEHRLPERPWSAEDLAAAVDALDRAATTLTPAPPGSPLGTYAEETAAWPAMWDRLRAAPPRLPGLAERLDEAAAMARASALVVGGSTLVHTDVRDDNVLLAADGRVLLCDWNWPVAGAAWLDTVVLLAGARGDGVDADAVLASARVARDVPPDHVDAVLALLAGYLLLMGDLRVPPTSPFLRASQRWQGEAAWAWLCERRGWA
ncbi:phosphotransferase [Nocardioides sp. SYSU DS0663]|uniref:phosphotransferase n=1 Tax=Nocardioides sp. SYSU DS0663 TaxID=3416445 RepID=UPI003F4C6E85